MKITIKRIRQIIREEMEVLHDPYKFKSQPPEPGDFNYFSKSQVKCPDCGRYQWLDDRGMIDFHDRGNDTCPGSNTRPDEIAAEGIIRKHR